jgi:two-component system phosphate regulon sensor histidine kinase PhoR
LLSPDASEARAYVVLRVTDQGPGIARQHLPRLS